jgi:hypothetical protein
VARLRAFDYYKVAIDLAGVLFLDLQKQESKYDNPKTEMELLIHVAIRAHLIPSQIDRLVFGEEEERHEHIYAFPIHYLRTSTPVDSWNAYLTIMSVYSQNSTYYCTICTYIIGEKYLQVSAQDMSTHIGCVM